MSVITNTTVISNFASIIGQLDLLKQLYGTVHISVEVYKEIQLGLAEGYQFYREVEQIIHPYASEGWIRLTSMVSEDELALFTRFPSHLHPGEASPMTKLPAQPRFG